MKFTVDRDSLADAVAWAARPLPGRPSSPILAGALLAVAGGRLTASGFDADVSAQVTVGVEPGSDGVALVHGRLLADIVRALPPRPVDVMVTDTELELACGSARFALPTMPVQDYPRTPPLPARIGTVDAAALAAAIAQVTVSASRDDSVPVLTAVRLEIAGDVISLLATDRYRLAVRELAWQPDDGQVHLEALAPARTLGDIAKAYAHLGGDVTLALDAPGSGGGLLGFTRPDRGMTSRLFDDVQYPAVHRLLDAARDLKARVPVADLLDVVRRVALVAERATPVSLGFAEGRVTVEARGVHNARAREELGADYSGDSLAMAFNPQFLLDGLNALAGPTAVFSFVDAVKPPVLTSATADGTPLPDFRYLIQPVRIRASVG